MLLEEADGAAILASGCELELEPFLQRSGALLLLRLARSGGRFVLHRCRSGLSHENGREQANE